MADETILIDIEYNTEEAKTEVDELTRSIEGLKVAQKQLDQELKDGKKSQVEYSKESAKIKTQLNEETKSRKDAIKFINATSGSYAKLQAQTNKLIARSKALDTTTEAGAKRFKALTTRINNNTSALKRMDAAQGRNNRNVGNYKDTLKGLGSTLGVVTGGVALAGLAIKKGIQITKQAIEVNREFEKSFANVLTLLDEAQKAEFRIELSQGAVDIMARYGLEIQDVNKALFDTISAGIPAGEAIEFLNKAAKLAIAGNAELSSVIDGATNVIGAYGDAAGTTEEILNGFFAAQVKGKTDVGLLATSIGKVASTAAAADVPLNELFGTFAGLTKFIGSTEESATSLAATMNSIINPSEDAKKAFKELGIETGFTGIQNNGLLNTLKQVADAYEDNSDVLSELIPNQRALKAVAGLTSEAIAEVEQNIIDLNDAESASILVQEAFNEQMSTSQKQAEQLSGTWNRLLIKIGGGESIFKKIGTGIRSTLTNQISDFTLKLERVSLVWDKLTGKLSKGEFLDAVIELETRFGTISENADDSSNSIDGVSDSIDSNTTTTNSNTEAVGQQITSIASLTEKVKELDKEKKALNITDTEGIAAKNKEIESIKGQISVLSQLGEAKKEEKISEVDFEKEIDEQLLADEQEINAFLLEEENNILNSKKEINDKFEEGKTAKIQGEEDKRRAAIGAAIQAIDQLAGQSAAFLNSLNQKRFDSKLARLEKENLSEVEFTRRKEKLEKDFAKKSQRIAIAQAITKAALVILNASLTQPYIPAGLAASAAAAISTGIQIATIKNAKFAKGGVLPLAKNGMKMGTFSGPSHSQGGIPIVNGLTGRPIAEVEGNENFYVVNKQASAHINSISDINQRIGGGVPLSNKSQHMADGGRADIETSQGGFNINDITKEVVDRLPPIITLIQDIKTGVQDYDDVVNVGVI